MAIPIKTPGEIAAMRSSGRLAWMIVQAVAAACRPGVTKRELDEVARKMITEHHLHPLLLGYRSTDGVEFPGAACICVNEEVVHAVPSDRIVREGDAVTVDVAIRDAAGWCADAAVTVVAGVGRRAQPLADLGRAALGAAIDRAGPGVMWSHVVQAAAGVAQRAGCQLVSGYCGHGIGRLMHELPRLCFGVAAAEAPRNHDVRLEPGMVVTLEPIVVEGPPTELVTLDDGWTVVTSSRAWAAHEERTVAITRRGCEVLTAP
jgi:methionyl aminopeptidase